MKTELYIDGNIQLESNGSNLAFGPYLFTLILRFKSSPLTYHRISIAIIETSGNWSLGLEGALYIVHDISISAVWYNVRVLGVLGRRIGFRVSIPAGGFVSIVRNRWRELLDLWLRLVSFLVGVWSYLHSTLPTNKNGITVERCRHTSHTWYTGSASFRI